MQTFRFDADAHAYYLGSERIPGVTAVLGQVVDFRFVSDEVLDRKRAIGSALHAAIEIDLDGELDEDSIDPSVAPYFAGWRKFQDEHGAFLIQAKERPIYSRTYRYGCTPDLWGNFLAGGEAVPFVCEIKSTATVHPAVGLQTAAQLQCIAEDAAPRGTGARAVAEFVGRARRFVLQLLPTGKYSLRQLTARDDFATFLALLTAYRWKQRHNIALTEFSGADRRPLE